MIDRRQIEFSDQDILRALALSPAAGRALGLPPERADSVLFHPSARVVVLNYNTAAGPNCLTLSAEAVGALLMSYLVRSAIPLPRHGTKSVVISACSLSITFEVELGYPMKARQPEAAKAIRSIAARAAVG